MEYPVRCLISSPGTVIFVCDRYHGAFPRRTDVHLEPRALGHTCCMQARTTSYRAPLSSVRHGHPAAGHCCAPLSGPGLRRTRHELQGAIAQVRGAISPAPDSAGVALIRPPTGGMAAWCSSEKIVSDGTIAKHHSTRGSRVIPQRSTSLAQPCLTSEIGRDRVCSEWYDRGIQFTPLLLLRIGYKARRQAQRPTSTGTSHRSVAWQHLTVDEAQVISLQARCTIPLETRSPSRLDDQ